MDADLRAISAGKAQPPYQIRLCPLGLPMRGCDSGQPITCISSALLHKAWGKACCRRSTQRSLQIAQLHPTLSRDLKDLRIITCGSAKRLRGRAMSIRTGQLGIRQALRQTSGSTHMAVQYRLRRWLKVVTSMSLLAARTCTMRSL